MKRRDQTRRNTVGVKVNFMVGLALTSVSSALHG